MTEIPSDPDPPPPGDAAPPVPAPAAPAPPAAPVVGPAFRTWLRYLVPLTLLSAIALSPVIALALAAPVPADLAGVRPVLRLGWILLAAGGLGQLVLVGGASAMTGAPRPQLGALGAGLVQLVRAVLPCAVAAAAIAIGSLALVVPGALLLVLLALTGASRERGLPAPLVDSIAAARRQLPAVALAVAALIAIDAAIGLAAFRACVPPIPARPTPAQLAGARAFVRAVVLALVIASPLPATVLATLRARAAR
jgi:hypothetical protein